MSMKCTVAVTWTDKTKKNKKTSYPCDKYFVKEGILALETRDLDPESGEPLKVKTLGIPLSTISMYEATYEKIIDAEEPSTEGA